MESTKISLGQALLLPATVRRAAKTSLLIGTLLVLVNHGDHILAGNWPPLWKIILTYMVPYGVACYAGAAMVCEQSRREPSKGDQA